MMQPVEASGLNIQFDPDALHISFVDGPQGKFQRPEYSVRSYGALAPILEDPASIQGEEETIVYWMYRNLGLQGNDHMVRQHSLRYDLSVFRQRLFGQELMKTSGHYHPAIWAGGPSYPEVYEVAFGKAIFLMQEVADINAGPAEVQVLNCIALECETGQKAIMPPDFGHVTLNPVAGQSLITTNWVCSDFASVYGGAELCRGFAWYHAQDRGWVENPTYQCAIPKLRFAKCVDVPELNMIACRGLYPSGIDNPERLAFIKRPYDFTRLLWSGIAFDDPADREWCSEYLDKFERKHASKGQ